MSGQSTWLSQINSELKWGVKQSNSQSKKGHNGWLILYSVLTIIVVISILTYVALQSYFKSQYMWYALAWIPFCVLGFAHSVIRREWQHHTFGWWLSLPFTRTRLVTTKFIACCTQMLAMAVGMYVTLTLLSVYTMLLQDNVMKLTTFLMWGLLWNVIILCFYPILTAFGMLSAMLVLSRLKSLLPLLWLLFWLGGTGVIWLLFIGDGQSNVFTEMNTLSETVYFPINIPLIGVVILSWLLTFVMMRWNGWILKNALDL